MIPRLTALLACIALSSCTTTLSTAARAVVAADDKMVVDCKFIGDVQGSSGFGNLAASAGMENAKNEALEKAAELGATHVVFGNVSGGYSPYATGKAYKCN